MFECKVFNLISWDKQQALPNRINRLTVLNCTKLTSRKFLFCTLCVDLVCSLIVINWLIGSVWVWPKVIPLSGIYCYTFFFNLDENSKCADKVEANHALEDLWIEPGDRVFKSRQACSNFNQDGYEEHERGNN